ncbi:MAG: DUF1611 domain-containing protein [Verrucomicrobia bacterium]|nr:DUF1611 domain-containing protein [Cytophagales bacterium]
MNNALVLTNGFYTEGTAKTAHGLVRGTQRFTIKGIIDHAASGNDAGTLLDGKARNIPILDSVESFFTQFPDTKINFIIVGIATLGGKLPSEMKEVFLKTIPKGISVVNGLHDFLNDHADLVALAQKHQVQLIDVRRPKPFHELHSWTGNIKQVTCPRIAVMGTDMGLGKRTTTKFLTDACNASGIKAEMIYTGQTGWMQGFKYGFILDSTLNDFVSGELENAVFECWKNEKPDVIFLEGQSSLRNPAGPCGAEYLLSAEAKGVIIQHGPGREFFRHQEKAGNRIPSLASEIELVRFYGSEVLATTFNTAGLSGEETLHYQSLYQQTLNLPVILPKEEGVEILLPIIKNFIKQHTKL